jgi:ADP-heptose:LPS heptosyltransferase
VHKPEIIIVHRGGLGDFLTAWPAMLSICKQFANHEQFWIGHADRLAWLRPLGVRACPRDKLPAFEKLFTSRRWPKTFSETQIYWFGLTKRPPVVVHPQLVFLQGLRADRLVPVREAYAKELHVHGVPFDPLWLEMWRRYFASASADTKRSGRDGALTLIFPGAGHAAKQWPLVQFFALARWLEDLGAKVRFVLGPAEAERGMLISQFPVAYPSSLSALQNLLNSADLVVGNDSGPMHLAGMLGVPGLVLFGPASELQWGPVGLRWIWADLPCRPCTSDGRIACLKARCMERLSQSRVRGELAAVLG